MQKSHPFYDLLLSRKPRFTAQECFEGYPNPQKIIVGTVFLITAFDFFLQWLLYPSLSEGSYPYSLTTTMLNVSSVLTYIVTLSKIINIAPKQWQLKLKVTLHCLAGFLYFAFLVKNITYYLERALDTNTSSDWTFTVLNVSNCIHSAILICMIVPIWYIKALVIFGCYVGIVAGYMGGNSDIKTWIIVKCTANFAFTGICIFLSSQFRWSTFLKYLESDVWTQIYQDLLNRMPTSIAILDMNGKNIYSNDGFKRLAEEHGIQLFDHFYRVQLNEAPLMLVKRSTTLLKRASNPEEAPASQNRSYLPDTPSVRIRLNDSPISSPERFSTLTELIAHFLALLKKNSVKDDEELFFEARLQKATLRQKRTVPYEITVKLDAKCRKLILIMNNTIEKERISILEEHNELKGKQLDLCTHDLKVPLQKNLSLLQRAIDEPVISRAIKDRLLIPAQKNGRILLHLLNDIID